MYVQRTNREQTIIRGKREHFEEKLENEKTGFMDLSAKFGPVYETCQVSCRASRELPNN